MRKARFIVEKLQRGVAVAVLVSYFARPANWLCHLSIYKPSVRKSDIIIITDVSREKETMEPPGTITARC